MPTVHLIIKGRVQGVFFRATAKNIADGIGVTGWIKNADDGNVEAMASGDDEQIQNFIAWCKVGSHKAIVTGVEVNDVKGKKFESFEIVRT